jgi:hypothetical protein
MARYIKTQAILAFEQVRIFLENFPEIILHEAPQSWPSDRIRM